MDFLQPTINPRLLRNQARHSLLSAQLSIKQVAKLRKRSPQLSRFQKIIRIPWPARKLKLRKPYRSRTRASRQAPTHFRSAERASAASNSRKGRAKMLPTEGSLFFEVSVPKLNSLPPSRNLCHALNVRDLAMRSTRVAAPEFLAPHPKNPPRSPVADAKPTRANVRPDPQAQIQSRPQAAAAATIREQNQQVRLGALPSWHDTSRSSPMNPLLSNRLGWEVSA